MDGLLVVVEWYCYVWFFLFGDWFGLVGMGGFFCVMVVWGYLYVYGID